MKARPIIEPRRDLTKNGNLRYVAVWAVTRSKNYPEGIKYSFALISKSKRVIGYDYHPTEGHHRHYMKGGKLVKEKYRFISIENTTKRFLAGVDTYEKNQSKED